MNFLKSTAVLCAVCLSGSGTKAGMLLQDSIGVPITGMDVLAQATPKWTTASAVTMDMGTGKVNYEQGAGILLHKAGTDDTPVALAAKASGDMEVNLDFMVSAGSDPVLYFLGKYPITLGGAHPGTVEMSPHAENLLLRKSTPTDNVAKAPGLWQHLKIRYRSAGGNGAMTKGADKPSFEAIYLNGVLIHQQVYLDAEGDNAAGEPLLSFLCRAGSVAFRNIHYRGLEALKEPTPPADPRAARWFYRVTNPIILNPDGRPYLLRSFLMFEGKKRMFTISVGNPGHSNFSYDMKQGALLQVWRGRFMDVTDMWEARGEAQTATPLGAVVTLTGKPALAVLANDTDRWPDTIAFDAMHNKGYSIDAAGIPTFAYEFAGMEVSDHIAHQADGSSLERTLDISNPVDGANCLVATGKTIRQLSKDLYAIDDQSYYVRIGKQSGATVRKTADGEELIVPVTKNGGHVSYSLIW